MKSPRVLRSAVQSEQMLLDVYSVTLPSLDDSVPMQCDNVSKDILTLFHPAILLDVFPVKTIGDGNCMYRSVSRLLTGSESYHMLLRLLTVIEIVSNNLYYDISAKKHIDLIGDNRIVVSPYNQLVKDAVTIGAYADMLHIYALSAAVGQPIRSYYPPQLSAEFLSEPFSRKVVGRNVQKSATPLGTVMWTQMTFGDTFQPNHFVPLVRKSSSNSNVTPIEVHDDDSVVKNVSVCLDDSLQCDVTNEQNVDDSDVLVDSNVSVDQDSDVLIDSNVPVCHDDSDVSNLDSSNSDLENSNSDLENEISFSNATSDACDETQSYGVLGNDFLSLEKIAEIFENPDEDKIVQQIPQGLKENVYFLANNQHNISDDCGVWDSGSGACPKTTYLKSHDGSLRTVIMKNGEYFSRKKTKGVVQLAKILPQPQESQVFTLKRYYASSKKDKNYKRRITSVPNKTYSIVEYLGKFPGLSSHGNCKTSSSEYVRTPQNVMSEMSDLLKQKRPLEVYNDLTNKHDELSGPRNKAQIRDKKKYDKKKDKQIVGNVKNMADNIEHLDEMTLKKGSIVRSVIRDQGKAPCVILYTDEQILDLKNMCANGKSIVGVDKTFNLIDMHVTVMTYKQVSVIDPKTGDHPIFFGPMYLHDNSDFESYANFFHHISNHLADSDTSKMVIGSDEEGGLVKGITRAFPDATHILCTRHIEENTKRQLIDEGVDRTDRKKIMGLLFGEDGLANSNDSICFDERSTEIDDLSRDISQKFNAYYQKKLKNVIKQKVCDPQNAQSIEKSWTNNNSESLNHVLKILVDWKPTSLLEYVKNIESHITAQFKDVRRALIGVGQYKLAPSHQKFQISKSVWGDKSEPERNNSYRRFRNYVEKYGINFKAVSIMRISMHIDSALLIKRCLNI